MGRCPVVAEQLPASFLEKKEGKEELKKFLMSRLMSKCFLVGSRGLRLSDLDTCWVICYNFIIRTSGGTT